MLEQFSQISITVTTNNMVRAVNSLDQIMILDERNQEIYGFKYRDEELEKALLEINSESMGLDEEAVI